MFTAVAGSYVPAKSDKTAVAALAANAQFYHTSSKLFCFPLKFENCEKISYAAQTNFYRSACWKTVVPSKWYQ